MPTPHEIVAAVERYEHLRTCLRTRERIFAEALLGRLLRATPHVVDHAGLRYAWSRSEGSIVRVEVREPRRRDGRRLPRKPTSSARDARKAVHTPRGSYRARGNSRNVL